MAHKQGKARQYQLRESIKSWPEGDRPREKLILRGARYLSDSELISLLLGAGSGSKNALDLARDLLVRFGGLPGIEAASVEEIKQVPGIGEAKAVSVKAGLEVGRRFVEANATDKSASIRTSEDVFEYYLPTLKNLRSEVFMVALLNTRNKIVKSVTISEGGLTAAMVHPRDVFTHAIRESANGVILMHNHPSGDPEPSTADINLTEQLKKAGELLSVTIFDHVIIGDGKYFSFTDAGLL